MSDYKQIWNEMLKRVPDNVRAFGESLPDAKMDEFVEMVTQFELPLQDAADELEFEYWRVDGQKRTAALESVVVRMLSDDADQQSTRFNFLDPGERTALSEWREMRFGEHPL